MSHKILKKAFSRGSFLAVALAYALPIIVGDALLFSPVANAAQLQTRSLQVSSSAGGNVTTDIAGNIATAGTGGNGAKTSETFVFTPSGSASVGSIEFLYCTTPLPSDTCTPPTGMDVSTVSTVGGTSASGWTVGTNTTNKVQITHTAATFTGAKNFVLGAGSTGTDYIKNPTNDTSSVPGDTTFFVRITTYSSTSYTGIVDQGTVASATAQQVDVTAKVQETLGFSVGTTPTDPSTTCEPFSDSGALSLGDPTNGVLSSTQAYNAHSYFRIYTNATHGAIVSYSGDTLKNGSNTIDAIGTTATASDPGTNQFGIGVDSTDTSPASHSGWGYHFTDMTASAPYSSVNTAGGDPTNSANKWAFDTASVATPKTIATSGSIITCDTGSVNYIGNIAATTPAGVYTTTITYIATPSY